MEKAFEKVCRQLADKKRREEALALVNQERERQISIWGDESGNHMFEWMSILMEEVGELAEAVNETCFQTEHVKSGRGGIKAIRREAVHVAAVAVAIAEATLKEETPKPEKEGGR